MPSSKVMMLQVVGVQEMINLVTTLTSSSHQLTIFAAIEI